VYSDTGTEEELGEEEGDETQDIDDIINDNVIESGEYIMDPDVVNCSVSPGGVECSSNDENEPTQNEQEHDMNELSQADDETTNDEDGPNTDEDGTDHNACTHDELGNDDGMQQADEPNMEDQGNADDDHLQQDCNNTATVPNTMHHSSENHSDNLHSDTGSEEWMEYSRKSSYSSEDFELIDRSNDDDELPSVSFYPAWKSSSVFLANNTIVEPTTNGDPNRATTTANTSSEEDPGPGTGIHQGGNGTNKLTKELTKFQEHKQGMNNQTGMKQNHVNHTTEQNSQLVEQLEDGTGCEYVPVVNLRDILDYRARHPFCPEDHCGPKSKPPTAAELTDEDWHPSYRPVDRYSLPKHYQSQWGCARCDSTLLVRTSNNKDEFQPQRRQNDATYPRQGQFQKRAEVTKVAKEPTAQVLPILEPQSDTGSREHKVNLTEEETSSMPSLVSNRESDGSLDSGTLDESLSDGSLTPTDWMNRLCVRTAPLPRHSSLSIDRPYTVQDDLDDVRKEILHRSSKLSFLDEYECQCTRQSEVSLELSQNEDGDLEDKAEDEEGNNFCL
jgi:hypothetical protein